MTELRGCGTYIPWIWNNEIMPFAGTWVVLDIIILNEVRKTNHIAYDITYMWNLKYDTNELIYENRDSQM